MKKYREESAWLLEFSGCKKKPVYFMIDSNGQANITDDAFEALRFSRKEDGERFYQMALSFQKSCGSIAVFLGGKVNQHAFEDNPIAIIN